MKNNSVEVNALASVPKEERRGWIAMAFVQAGICVCVPAFLLGAILGESMPLWQAIISGSLGYLIIVVAMCILGMIGSDLGLASCTIAESTFGKSGARYVVSLLFAINLIAWFGIQNGVCGEAFSNFMTQYAGIPISVTASSVIWGFIMLATAIFGVSALEKLDYISIPLLIIIMAYGTVLALNQYGTASLSNDAVQTMSFLGGVSLSFNFTAVGTITAADYTRFQKSRKDTIWSILWGVFPMGIITLVLGIILTKIANEYDISMVLIKIGIPVLGIITLVLSTWTTNATNAYSSGLDLTMVFKLPDNKRREVTFVAGIVGIILGIMGILDHIESYLSFLSFLVCPIGGIMIADYWLVGKGKSENWHSVDGFNNIGILTWAISTVLSFLVRIEYMGIIFGMIIYLVFERFCPSKSRGDL